MSPTILNYALEALKRRKHTCKLNDLAPGALLPFTKPGTVKGSGCGGRAPSPEGGALPGLWPSLPSHARAEVEGRVEFDLTACEAEDQPCGSTRPTPVPKDQKRLLEVSLATWDPEGGRYVMDIHLASALNHLATCGLKRRTE